LLLFINIFIFLTHFIISKGGQALLCKFIYRFCEFVTKKYRRIFSDGLRFKQTKIYKGLNIRLRLHAFGQKPCRAALKVAPLAFFKGRYKYRPHSLILPYAKYTPRV